MNKPEFRLATERLLNLMWLHTMNDNCIGSMDLNIEVQSPATLKKTLFARLSFEMMAGPAADELFIKCNEYGFIKGAITVSHNHTTAEFNLEIPFAPGGKVDEVLDLIERAITNRGFT